MLIQGAAGGVGNREEQPSGQSGKGGKGNRKVCVHSRERTRERRTQLAIGRGDNVSPMVYRGK